MPADNSDRGEVGNRHRRRGIRLRRACSVILSFLLCVKNPNKRSRRNFRIVTPLASQRVSTARITLRSHEKNFDGFNSNNNGNFYNGFNGIGMENSIDGDFGYDPATDNGSNGYGMDNGKVGSPGSWEECKARTSGLGKAAESGKSGYVMTVQVDVHEPPPESIPEDSDEAVECDSSSPNVNVRTALQRIEDLETKLFIMDEANQKLSEELAELKEDTLEIIGEVAKLYIIDAQREKTFQIIVKNCKYLGGVSVKQIRNSRRIISDVLEIFESSNVQQAEFQVGITSVLQMLDAKVRQMFIQIVTLKDFVTEIHTHLMNLITSIGNYFQFSNQRNSHRNRT